MTAAAQSEAHTAAAETRALWREYLTVFGDIQANMRAIAPFAVVTWDDPVIVGRVVRLLREQRRILDELLGRKP